MNQIINNTTEYRYNSHILNEKSMKIIFIGTQTWRKFSIIGSMLPF